MKTHELARLLLSFPDAELTVTASRHHYTEDIDGRSHGPFLIQRIHHYARGERIAIGNGLENNSTNWHPLETLWSSRASMNREDERAENAST